MGCKNSKEGPRFSEPAPLAAYTVVPASNVHDEAADEPTHQRVAAAPEASPVRPSAVEISNVVLTPANPSRAGKSTNGTAGVSPPGTAGSSASPIKKDPRFKSNGPTQHGDIQPCFKDGLLYRIVQPNAWYFYNDTQEYEMHVSFQFGADSDITAVPPAVMQRGAGEDRCFVVSVIVYPGETSGFIEGKYNGYKSNIAARAMSAEYRKRMNAEANLKVQRELDVIQKLCRGSTDVERILHACVEQGIKFVDVSFPPFTSSLSRPSDSRTIPDTAWKRPTDYLPMELHRDISLFRNGVDPNDIDQGQLGDCWFLCSVSALAEFPSKVEDVFCHPVSAALAKREQQVGAYHVTLNKHGWWYTLIVDDYFPVIGQKPCFAKGVKDPAELWVSLLEKAYAKLHGSYAAITGGDALQALQDLTGYPVFRFDELWMAAVRDRESNTSKSEALFHRLLDYDQRKFLVNLNTPGYDTTSYATVANNKTSQLVNPKSVEEQYKKAGLCLGHAYTALQCRYFSEHNLRLVQIRNPWGNGMEWSGRWGDDDAAWADFPDVARAVDFHPAEDGTFWMQWDDVLQYFDGGGVCFTQFGWHDYRARGRFENGFPSLVFEVHVTKPVEAYFMLSQKDRRGLPSSDPDSKYSALMLSVSHHVVASSTSLRNQHHQQHPATTSTKQIIHVNSTANPEEPSEEFTFNYARDLGLRYTFTPEASPYYIIPRIYDAGGNKDYVMGMITDAGVDTTSFAAKFVTLPKTCRVFHNYSAFQVDGKTDVEAEFQFNPEVGAPQTTRGFEFC